MRNFLGNSEQNKDFLPTATLETLRRRADVLRRIRRFFEQRNFFEVETPLLSHDIVVDRYLLPIPVLKCGVTGKTEDRDVQLWLQTSPEFGMKRLIAAGAEAIFQICKAFRNEEVGPIHNPEFTMLEWYRIGDDLHTGMDLLAEFVEQMLEKPKTQRLTYRAAFEQFAGIDPFEASTNDLALMAKKAIPELEPSIASCRDALLNLILSEIIQPNLGLDSPTIIYDWPPSQAALAIVREQVPAVAERFEIYVNGIELANGYHELLDPEELERRNSINNQARVKDGNPILPEQSRLLAAMRHGMPQCAGVALGIDRLVMLALEANSIDEVLAFPIQNA